HTRSTRDWSSDVCSSDLTLGPNPCQGSLLADAGFILPPKFDRLAARAQWDAGCDQIGKVFLCAAWVAASCWGARGRTDIRRNPRRCSSAPTERSARVTP